VKEVLEQLKAVAKGDPKTPDTVKRKFGNIIFAAVRLTPSDILGVLRKVRTECAALPLRICSSYMQVLLTLFLFICRGLV
jgi:hypothetical protein